MKAFWERLRIRKRVHAPREEGSWPVKRGDIEESKIGTTSYGMLPERRRAEEK